MGELPALQRLLAILREAHVSPAAETIPLTPAQRLAAQYRRYLSEERGCCDETVENYGRHIDRLVDQRFGSGPVKASCLQARDIIEFVEANARQHGRGYILQVITALRSFLRFLRYRGHITTDLAASVPSVAHWQKADLPKHLPAGAVQKVLDACDRTTAGGRRNYAILLLLARLGLRAGEVIAMQLEDIDWENAQLTVRSKKGRGWARLPLPADVGSALAQYLRHDRPQCPSRNVFVRLVAPYEPLSNSPVIAVLTRKALEKAGVESTRKGAHIFRHSLATEMLRQGASLDEIGQVLRHKDPDTTVIYAKVDLDTLRKLAIAWPGGAL
jgi:site-specific recombinase XerD